MLVYRIDEYEVKRVRRGWVVVNTKGDYENHSHFYFSRRAAILCAMYASRKLIRRCEGAYMLEACRRITTDKDYKMRLTRLLDRLGSCEAAEKDRYVNKTVMQYQNKGPV